MVPMIPQPQKAEWGENILSFSKSTQFTGAFSQIFPVLQGMMSDVSGQENRLIFEKNEKIPREGYKISCENNDIRVQASDEAGAFYAVMTLLQCAQDKGWIREMTAEDEPRFHFRSYMLDSSRHFWTVEQIKTIMDVMARLKLNVFHWHLTDDQGWRMEIKKYPLLTEKGSIRKTTLLNGDCENGPRENKEYGRGMFYTQEQARDIVAYAKERCIEVIPEIDMPGHFVAAISCYPHLSCDGKNIEVSDTWGINENIACCGKEDIYTFVEDIIDELCEIFPCRYFHIGGDEVPKAHWKACPACQKKIRELGLPDEDSLQAHFNNMICKYLRNKGKTVIGWNEILETREELDSSIVPQWWIFRNNDVNERKWLAAGNKMILSELGHTYVNMPFKYIPLQFTYDYGPKSMGIEDDKNILGIEAPLWTEYFRTYEHLSVYTYVRLLALSETCWTWEEKKNYADFENRVEEMRPCFEKMGVKIAPQEMYRGEVPEEERSIEKRHEIYWKVWSDNPRFEMQINHVI